LLFFPHKNSHGVQRGKMGAQASHQQQVKTRAYDFGTL
jgi:hypothetical protein